jgi:Fe-S oxidoreductase
MDPGSIIRPIIVTLMLLTAFGTFAYTAKKRIRLLLSGRKKLNRFDNIPARIGAVLQYAVAQQRMFKDPYAGIFHILIFSGFMILGLRTASLYLLGYNPGLFYDIFTTGPGLVYIAAKDIIEPLVAIGVGMAIWRRVVEKPARLTYSGEAVFILGMIGTLMVTDLFYDACEFVLAYRGTLDPAHIDAVKLIEQWSPASGGLAAAFMGAPDGFLHAFGSLNYYVHVATVLVFLNFLPYGKHFHVITAIPNVFFKNLGSPGALSKIEDLEGRVEREENIGAGRVEDYAWKDILDMYTCTECGRCQAVCPAWSTEKPLSPKKLVDDQRDHIYAKSDWVLGHDKGTKEDWEGDAMIGPVIAEDVIWSCTTCRNCETACPVMIEHVDRIVAMRRYLVTNMGSFPQELTRTFQGMERNGNPWNLGADKRLDWTEGLDVKMLDEGQGAEYLYWVGCAASYDDRNKKIAQALIRIFTEAGVDYGVMMEETCNGDTARRAGNEYLFQIMAQANIENLNAHKTKKIVTHCPHCLNTLKNEYPQFGAQFEVVHSTELVNKLMAEGKLKVNPLESEGPVTFHDPCYLGRYNDQYAGPRALVEKSTGKAITEAERSRENSMCCGAGGARMWMEEHAPRVNELRYSQLMETGAKTVAVSCPFCMTMIDDANKSAGNEEKVKVYDVIELVDKALVKKAATA